MAKADQRDHDHVPKAPQVDPSLLAEMEEPATAKIRALLQQGVANAGMFAKIVHENPQAKGEIVALLNNKLGNGFTTKVIEISEVEDSPRQGKPPVMSQAARDELNDGAYSSDGTTGHKPKDAATGKPPSAANRAEAMEMFREVNGGPAQGKPPSAANRAEAMEMFREVNGGPAQGKPPSAANRAEAMEMFREVNGPPAAAADANVVIGASNETKQPEVKRDELLGPTRGKPPSAENRAEVMEMFREVNGGPTRGKPPSAKNRAEAMELFREVNGGPDKGGDEKRAEDEQTRPQEQEIAKTDDHGDEKHADGGSEKRADEEQARPQEQELAKTDDHGDEKRVDVEQTRPQEQELAKSDDHGDEKSAGEEQQKKDESQHTNVVIGASSQRVADKVSTKELAGPQSTKSLGPVRVTASVLHVRSTPGIVANNIVGRLHRGQTVNAVGRSGDWVQIEFQGQQAYVHHSYVVGVSNDVARKTPKDAKSSDKPA